MVISQSVCRHMLKMKSLAKPLTVARHEYLYLEADPAESVYLLEQGMIMLTKLMPDGHEVGIIFLSGKNIFGQCEVLGGSNREHQAMGLTDSKLWQIKAELFLQQTQCSQELSLALARVQNERLRHMEQHIRSIYQDSVANRLRKTLYELAQGSGCDPSGGVQIRPCPTHQDLATMVASTRETVSTEMNKLRKQNIITFNRKEIRITKLQSLVVRPEELVN